MCKFELTSIMDKAAQKGRFYFKNEKGNLATKAGLRRDLSDLRDELNRLKERLSQAKDEAEKRKIKNDMRQLLRDYNCSRLMNEIGNQLRERLKQGGLQDDDTANLLGKEWLAPQQSTTKLSRSSSILALNRDFVVFDLYSLAARAQPRRAAFSPKQPAKARIASAYFMNHGFVITVLDL
jgi:hypothetical protein